MLCIVLNCAKLAGFSCYEEKNGSFQHPLSDCGSLIHYVKHLRLQVEMAHYVCKSSLFKRIKKADGPGIRIHLPVVASESAG